MKTEATAAVEVGSIFYSSWGYEQTNIDFYKVVGMTKATVTLQRIGAIKTESGWETGTVVPNPERTIGDSFRRKLINGDSARINSFSYASLWDGRPRRYSSYA